MALSVHREGPPSAENRKARTCVGLWHLQGAENEPSVPAYSALMA